jgi:hypothetical protein
MIICPNCQHKEVSGAVFCSQCGAQLVTPIGIDTHKINTAETRERVKGDTKPYQPPPPTTLDSWVSLHMVESGQILPLADRAEFTLGRVTEGQPIMPDVDLSHFNAYANGVSRLHAVLKRINKHTIIMDLGSSNGTYINGSRITPHIEHPLAHGDVVYLGKLKIQVLLGQDLRLT